MESSGSEQFDRLRERMIGDPYLRHELEFALRLNIERVNPADRANRFGSGAAVEWIVASMAFAAGILTLPAGHNADGFDLSDIRQVAGNLWSVKNTTRRSDFRLSNGMGGAGRGFSHPLLLLSPALPGLVFADPIFHSELHEKCKRTPDATILPFRVALEHAQKHPECVAACTMPVNHGQGQDDPWMDYVSSLLEPERFPQLSKLFVKASPSQRTVSDELERLVILRDSGIIDGASFTRFVDRL